MFCGPLQLNPDDGRCARKFENLKISPPGDVTVLRGFHSITGDPEKCSRRILVAGF
jgi:hypothetical protein